MSAVKGEVANIRMEVPPEGGKVTVTTPFWSWEIAADDAVRIGEALAHCAKLAQKWALLTPIQRGPSVQYRMQTGLVQ